MILTGKLFKHKKCLFLRDYCLRYLFYAISKGQFSNTQVLTKININQSATNKSRWNKNNKTIAGFYNMSLSISNYTYTNIFLEEQIFS